MLAYLTILRPLNLLQATLAVILTTFLLGEQDQLVTLILLILSVILINGAGNIINDIYDLEIDRVNRPNRPLPAGTMSIYTARYYMIFLFFIGILCSWLVSFQTFIIAGLVATPVLIAYSIWLKRLPLIGNLTVSFMLGLTFIYVGSAFGAINVTLIMAALAFGFTLIRELVKDLEDMVGDHQSGARTLPLIWGEMATRNFTISLIVVFMVLDLFPAVLGAYNDHYLWIVILGINVPLLLCAIALWKFPAKKNYGRIQIFLKLNIFIGLAALYLGRPV
ncbi:MAG: geranylgeranylglycerol-phosphate geranylgeranyltransferase [Candidatus Marinimicrobia bacterium]|nr:geranylgeranylglycerol-phosphate geranylgeranyltransferase [Candidatus Neomarinimicrobiota bacterium]